MVAPALALPWELQNTSRAFGSSNSHPHRAASYSTFLNRCCAFSLRQNLRKETGRVPQTAFKTQGVPAKVAEKTLSTPNWPRAGRLGLRAFYAADRSWLRILTGLSQLCSLSSRALWQALCLPHLAVAQSSGPRPEGTFRPPLACRLPAPVRPPRGSHCPGRRPSEPRRALPRARRRSAHPGQASAAGRQPGHVRAAAIGPRERGRAGKGGKGRVEAK